MSVSLPTKSRAPRKTYTDIVGLELGADTAAGVPAVRLRKREGQTELLAAGFLNLPGKLPETPGPDGAKRTIWSLPREFQAPHAALAVSSSFAFLRHSTGAVDDATEKKQFAYRQASLITAPDLPPFVIGLPEFQSVWAAQLLPEGCRPTACSLQVSAAAALSGFMATPSFASTGGNAVVLVVFPEHTALAAFQETRLVLYREHPVGTRHLQNAISAQMGIEVALADTVLEDNLIDPLPIIDPVLRPLFRQVEISADYLLRRRNCPVEHFFTCGLAAGSRYWAKVFAHMMNQSLTFCSPLDGIQTVEKPSGLPKEKDLAGVAPFLMSAIGAARAVLEDV